jgi:hypothetical protein
MFHRARFPGQRFAFAPAKTRFSIRVQGGAGLFRIMLRGRLHQIRAGRVRSLEWPSPVSGALKIGHQANSGFRLGPSTYTLPYSP